MVKIKLLGSLRAILGKSEVEIENVKTVSDLLNSLKMVGDKRVNLQLSNTLIIVNGTEVSALQGLNTNLKDDDDIVLIPVIHGG
ncbi:MAG: MoaD/ThiS family protein [Nitrososphaerales archaeon]|nr:MoaD/ThiS family protein [Nitrososphaerales archaeon]